MKIPEECMVEITVNVSNRQTGDVASVLEALKSHIDQKRHDAVRLCQEDNRTLVFSIPLKYHCQSKSGNRERLFLLGLIVGTLGVGGVKVATPLF